MGLVAIPLQPRRPGAGRRRRGAVGAGRGAPVICQPTAASATPREAVEDFEDFEAAMREHDDQRVAALAVGGSHRAPTGADDEHPRARRVRLRSEVGWNTINAKPGFLTSYYFSPEDITSDVFNQMWSLRSDDIVHVTMLRQPHHGGPVSVSALLRTNDPRRPEQPPTLFLNRLPGEQYAAALRVAPTSQPRLKLPTRVLDTPDKLHIPIGPTGVLVGAALRDDRTGVPEIQRDDLVMWPLTDPQQPTRITMDTSEFYVRQLLIRAAATGERIAIYSREPKRWYSVAEPNIAVVEPRRPPSSCRPSSSTTGPTLPHRSVCLRR